MAGLCLVNDWSARDVQDWEYQPLGPFLAKNFATTVSPWLVTIEALAPFRVPAFKRPEGDPAPLAYLDSSGDRASGGFDVTLEVLLTSRRMREAGCPAIRLSRGNLSRMYWTFAQMLAHHTSNGCNLKAGDLLASGTVSGPTEDSRGCLLELHVARHQPDRAADRRIAEVPRGRRRGGDARLVLARRLPADRVRRVPGDGHARGADVQPSVPTSSPSTPGSRSTSTARR